MPATSKPWTEIPGDKVDAEGPVTEELCKFLDPEILEELLGNQNHLPKHHSCNGVDIEMEIR